MMRWTFSTFWISTLPEREFITAGALDGNEGLEKVDSFRPDLIILDLMLPGVDGWEVCRRLKEQKAG